MAIEQITVDLVDLHPSPSKERWKVVCPNKTINITANSGEDIEWIPGNNVARIVLVAFKGRSPFTVGPGANKQDVVVLEEGGPGTVPGTSGSLKTVGLPSGSQGTYSYTIVVKGQTPDRAFALDPDLDII